MATSDNLRFGKGRFRKLKKPVEDPIKAACEPTNAPPPQWMSDKTLLPKRPPMRLEPKASEK